MLLSTFVVCEASASVPAMIAYGESTFEEPRWSTWDGTSWSAERMALPVGGEILWCELASCPQRREQILGVLDASGHLNVQVYSDSTWGNLVEMTTNIDPANAIYRGFDIEYEQLSGRALVVYQEDSPDPVYRIWDGTAWSGAQTIDISTDEVPVWIRLAHDPYSNSIALITLDIQEDVGSAMWNDTSWTDSRRLTNRAVTFQEECMDVSFFGQSGEALFAYCPDNRDYFRYRILDSGGWSGEEDGPDVGARIRLVKIAANGPTDSLAVAYVDENSKGWVSIWDNPGFQQNYNFEPDSVAVGSAQCFDLAWEPSSDEVVVVWSGALDTLQQNIVQTSPVPDARISYCTWSAGTWSPELLGPDLMSSIRLVSLDASPGHDRMFLQTVTDNNCLHVNRWNGSGWDPTYDPEPNISTVLYKPLSLSFERGPVPAPILVSPGDSTWTMGTRPTFQWAAPSHPDIDFYIISVDTESTFTTPLEILDSTKSTFYVPIVDLAQGEHFWMVAAVDSSGKIGDASEIWMVGINGQSLSFNITVTPQPIVLGESAWVEVQPNKAIPAIPACTLWDASNNFTAVNLAQSDPIYTGTCLPVGLIAGQGRIEVSGVDLSGSPVKSDTVCQIVAGLDFLPRGLVYAYPNPAPTDYYGDLVYFRFYVGSNCEVKVDIYTIEGKHVERLEGTGQGGSKENELVWSIESIASQILFYRVVATDKETSRSASVKKKLAIIK